MLLGRGRPEGGACVRLVRHISDESGDPPGAAGTAAKILRPPVERRGRTVPHRQGAIEFLMCQRELAVNVDSRSEEHTSELQSLMRISYAVFCLKKKKIETNTLN